MELQQTIITVLLAILLTVLSIVGIQLFFLLNEFRKTLHKVNNVVEEAEDKVNALIQPLRQLSSAAIGFQTGMKAIEAVMEWVTEKRQATNSALEEIGEEEEMDGATAETVTTKSRPSNKEKSGSKQKSKAK